MKNARFTEHYIEYFSLICGILYSKVKDPDTAEDMAQEIFAVLYRKYDEVRKVRAWLMAAARLALMEHRRIAGRQPLSLATEDLTVAARAVPDTVDTRMVLAEAIESITGSIDRVVFDLISIQDYSCSEAASAVGLTRRQVKYRHRLAVRQVLRALENRGLKTIEDLL